MLYLDRRKNQVIKVRHNESGMEMGLIVLDIIGGTVRLGFENDEKTFTILRKEIDQANNKVENPNPWYKDMFPTYAKGTTHVPQKATAVLADETTTQESSETATEAEPVAA